MVFAGRVQEQLPVLNANRSGIGSRIQDDFGMRRRLAGGDRGPDVDTVQGDWLLRRGASQGEQGGIPIHHMHRLIDDRAGCDLARPTDQRGYTNTTLIERPLAGAKRTIVGHHARIGTTVVAVKHD